MDKKKQKLSGWLQPPSWYSAIRDAILNKHQVTAIYQGHYRSCVPIPSATKEVGKKHCSISLEGAAVVDWGPQETDTIGAVYL